MSVEVVDGKVQFKYDLGSGAVTLTSDKVVSDSAWHQVIIERYCCNYNNTVIVSLSYSLSHCCNGFILPRRFLVLILSFSFLFRC